MYSPDDESLKIMEIFILYFFLAYDLENFYISIVLYIFRIVNFKLWIITGANSGYLWIFVVMKGMWV